ncbi:MAG: hypothetical protein KKC55_13785 [Gammaproteobacteria bacterium]|nr:hypothetical protein [Gammaproteobacteria bacterium]
MMDEDDVEFLKFIFRLLALPDAKQGRYGKGGISTNCIRWIMAYAIDAPQEGLQSARQISAYMGFSSSFYEQVKEMLRRNKADVLNSVSRKEVYR